MLSTFLEQDTIVTKPVFSSLASSYIWVECISTTAHLTLHIENQLIFLPRAGFGKNKGHVGRTLLPQLAFRCRSQWQGAQRVLSFNVELVCGYSGVPSPQPTTMVICRVTSFICGVLATAMEPPLPGGCWLWQWSLLCLGVAGYRDEASSTCGGTGYSDRASSTCGVLSIALSKAGG